MALGTPLVSLVRSRVVAQLERWGCSILYTTFPENPFITNDAISWGRSFFCFPRKKSGQYRNFGKILKNSEDLSSLKDRPQTMYPDIFSYLAYFYAQ